MSDSAAGRRAAYQWSHDGETWEDTSRERVRARAGDAAALALANGEIEEVRSRDGEVVYRRKPKEE